MKSKYKLAIAVLIALVIVATSNIIQAYESGTEEIVGSSKEVLDANQVSDHSSKPIVIYSNKIYLIESRRFIGEDGKATYDKWDVMGKSIEITKDQQFIIFFPFTGENAGKEHYIPISNIHIIREV